MNKKEATEILRHHNEWRRYDGEVGKGPEMTDPKKLGEAIDMVVSAMEEAYPECKEDNEDEKIRQQLIQGMENLAKTGRINFYNASIKDCIAWLEKQREASKAIEAVERIDKYIDEHLANAHDMKDSNPEKKYYRGWDDALGVMSGILQDVYSSEKQKERVPENSETGTRKEQEPDTRDADDLQLLGFIYDLLNEIKWKDSWAMSKEECLRRLNDYRPQKPAEWDELQSEFRNINEAFEDGKKEVVDNPEKYGLCKPAEWNDTDMKEARDNLISVCRDWERGEKTTLLPIVALRARYFLEHLTESKPAEWNEDDEIMLNDILARLEALLEDNSRTQVFKYTIKTDIDWLKSLPERFVLQPKQEWSEEDEIYLQDALWCVKQASKIARGENDMGACWSAERWLKALKNRGNSLKSNTNSPSWKPSKEQKEGLFHACNRMTGDYYHDALVSLYNDLKKLMEE